MGNNELITNVERERVVAPNHRDISRRKFLALAGVSAFAISSIGTYNTLAYFTGTNTKVNETTVAKDLKIEVVEPNWDPENGKHVVPAETIPKDPYVHNLSDTIPGYMYIEIRVPIITASIFNEKTQQTEPPAEIPLFSYTPNENWTQINTFIDDTDPDNKVQVTRYYWKDIIQPGGITETIFDEVVVANITSAKGVSGKHTIDAIGYGIQSEGFEDALSAWMAYKNQNGILDGDGSLEVVANVDVVINTNYATTGESFNLVRDELTNVIQTTECEGNGKIIFNEVPIVLNKTYSLLSSNISDPNNEDVLYEKVFLEDELEEINNSGQFTGESNRTFFAIYSKDDNSFSFYNRPLVPEEGGAYKGKEVTNLYTRFATWDGIRGLVENVYIIDEGITPENTRGWFSWFVNCVSFNNLDKLNTEKVKDMSTMFTNCTSLQTLDVSNLNVSNVVEIRQIFQHCSSLKVLNIENWDTINMKYMNSMFSDCSSLENLDVSNFNTSNAIVMDNMFSKCKKLKAIDLSNFITTNVKLMHSMFDRCEALEEINLSNFNTNNLTDMSSMFFRCKNLKTIDLTSFNTTKVTDMRSLFNGCSSLKSIDLSSFNTSKVKYMTEIFKNCSILETIYASPLWNTDLVSSSDDLFNGCSGSHLVGGKGTRYIMTQQGKNYARIDNPPDAPGYFTAKN